MPAACHIKPTNAPTVEQHAGAQQVPHATFLITDICKFSQIHDNPSPRLLLILQAVRLTCAAQSGLEQRHLP